MKIPFSPRLTKRPSEFHVRSPETLVALALCRAMSMMLPKLSCRTSPLLRDISDCPSHAILLTDARALKFPHQKIGIKQEDNKAGLDDRSAYIFLHLPQPLGRFCCMKTMGESNYFSPGRVKPGSTELAAASRYIMLSLRVEAGC
jgi:hypothetical protein